MTSPLIDVEEYIIYRDQLKEINKNKKDKNAPDSNFRHTLDVQKSKRTSL